MNIRSDYQKGTTTLSPTDETECAALQILADKGPGYAAAYVSRRWGGVDLHIRARMLFDLRIDDCLLTLKASNNESERCLRDLWNALYFSGSASSKGKLVTLSSVETEEGPALTSCVRFCKDCNAPLIDEMRCAWSTCHACMNRCAHDFHPGHPHGGKHGTIWSTMLCMECGQEDAAKTIEHFGRIILV